MPWFNLAVSWPAFWGSEGTCSRVEPRKREGQERRDLWTLRPRMTPSTCLPYTCHFHLACAFTFASPSLFHTSINSPVLLLYRRLQPQPSLHCRQPPFAACETTVREGLRRGTSYMNHPYRCPTSVQHSRLLASLCLSHLSYLTIVSSSPTYGHRQ